MRWMWIDRILELEKGRRCVTIKNISLAEEVLHDHFPTLRSPTGQTLRPSIPVLPNSLIIEGMAQTAGILVGHANDFREKVILAKIGKASFSAAAFPGYTLRFSATIENLDASAASTSGIVQLLDPANPSAPPIPLASIELLFSHLDHNISGLEFPDFNFVFTDQFMNLLRTSGFAQD